MVSGPPTLEEQLSILKAIKDTVDANLAELQHAYGDRQIGAIAWRSRNLLELAIWSEHCAASRENAKEFLLDSARDACDVLNIPEGPWLHDSLKPTRQVLLDNASADGFDIEQDYARVSAVAKGLGRADVFKHLNKVFSKYGDDSFGRTQPFGSPPYNAAASRGEGLDATANFRPSSAQRGNISLDIPFYRTEGL